MINDIWLSRALVVEVPYETFWNLNPSKVMAFEKAYNTRINHSAWLNGLYMRNAIVSAFSEQAKYPDNPIDFEEKKADKPKSLNETAKSETQNPDAIIFSAWADVFNEKFMQQQTESNLNNSDGHEPHESVVK